MFRRSGVVAAAPALSACAPPLPPTVDPAWSADDPHIHGFGLTHLAGVGCPELGAPVVAAVTGRLPGYDVSPDLAGDGTLHVELADAP